MAESREVAAFRRCYSNLQEGIKHELSEFVPRLYAKNLVSTLNKDKALSPTVPRGQRATDLLTVLESKILIEPDSFYSILRELDSYPTLTPLAQKLQSELEDQQLTDQRSPEESCDNDDPCDVSSEPVREAAKQEMLIGKKMNEDEHKQENGDSLIVDVPPSVPSPNLTTSDHPAASLLLTDTEQRECVTDCSAVATVADILPTAEDITTTENTEEMGEHIQAQKPSPTKCTKHDDEVLKLFCFTCNCLICRDCIIYDHADHNHRFVRDSAPQCRSRLRESLAPLRQIQVVITSAVSNIQTAKREVAENHNTVLNTISQSIDHLITILQQRKKDLLSMASELAKEKLEALNAQEKSLNMSLAEAQSMIDFVERSLDNATDEELLEMQQQIVTGVEENCKKQQQVDLQPAAKANIGTDMSCDQQALCAVGLVGLDVIDLTKCRAEDLDKEVEINKPAQFTVHLVDSADHSYINLHSIIVELKSHVAGSVVPATITPDGSDGTYSATYIPHIRGRHYITVQVNGREIIGSPFSVLVQIPPSQLQQPVRTIGGVKSPCGIAINKNDEVLVAEFDGARVSVFNKQGKTLQIIQHDDLPNPYGIATDPDGNVYVCSRKISAKFSKGGHSQTVIRKQSNWFRFMRVINGMLLVCCGISHAVLVYDCNTLRQINSFGMKGEGNGEFKIPYDVLSVNGELYVSDRDNRRIQVFDQKGLSFVRSFKVENTYAQKLCKPFGICVGPDGLLYVACSDPSCVLVFTLSGEFVASLGEVEHPTGVAVDSDGFVYVSNINTVLVF